MNSKTIIYPINPNSLRQRILALAVGETLFISIDEHTESAARYYASELGFKFDRKYKTHRDRERRGYTVTREA